MLWSSTDLLSRIMGSRAFTAVVRAVLYTARRDEDPEQEFWEPSEPQERRIKPGQGHIIENAADHPSAVVDHLNFELIDDDDLRVGQVRPHKTDVAEHVVGL